ncbi:asparaginase [Rhodocytophaga rosea]|uniref:asparaginase n=1 Tax=Rhodocytophaga rosea TaxID=2704465 RepID=A0A6C0GEV6_9BACT|nr:asparaginase [Rhodocytophaga rosea]QHT66531.1 asparaginase [Rhodocytophaga rosea]
MYTTVKIRTAATPQASTSILTLYTGGTFGMVYNRAGQLVPFDFEHIVERVPELSRFDFELTVIAFAKPIDSSNVTPEHWIEMAQIIYNNYELYDGFVILHGTDTMAYSASALSFLLENLNKPVIFTGSQIPIGAVRTDARRNLITALEIASARNAEGNPMVPEVCIYFNNFLWRGNRAKKVESAHFDAFYSDNYPALAEAGISIDYNKQLIMPYKRANDIKCCTKMNSNVAILKLFPGIHLNIVNNILHIPGLKGLVLETYGSGNAPTSAGFIDALAEAIDRQVIILNISQCSGGKVVQGKYETSKKLAEIGVLSGKDLTTEAGITKMMYLLGRENFLEDVKKQLICPIRGEML